MSIYIVKAVATEAGVGRAEAKSVLVALSSVVVREVLAKRVLSRPRFGRRAEEDREGTAGRH